MEMRKTEAIAEAALKKQEASPDLLSNRTGSSHKPRGYELRITLNPDVDHEEIRRRIMKFVDVFMEDQSFN